MSALILTSLSACLVAPCGFQYGQANIQEWSPRQQQVTQTSATQSTQELLISAYQEELLAHDIYTYMVSKYPELVSITPIIQSEALHQKSVGKLLDSRGIARPTSYGVYADTYATLKKMIDTSRNSAIEVGIMVETGDISHLLEEYKKVSDPDIRRVFENIGGGSFNHLRAFLRLAEENNYTVKTDYARYMTADEVNSAGRLKSKMTDLLKANNLPTFGTQGRGNGDGRGPTGTGERRGGGQGQGNGMGPMNR